MCDDDLVVFCFCVFLYGEEVVVENVGVVY